MSRLLKIFCLTLLFLAGKGVDAADEKMYQYIEGELFTSATANIKIMDLSELKTSGKEQSDADWFVKRSGWDREYGLDVSNSKFIQVMKEATATDRLAYLFEVPQTGNYYIWIRSNSVPPCFRRFSIWIDRTEPAADEFFTQLYFAFWNIWSWWPLGYRVDNGYAKPYSLTKGRHILYIGYMNKELKIDKLLITNDAKYRPYGVIQDHYTSSFEPTTIIDFHSMTRPDSGPIEATGWGHSPEDRWSIAYDDIFRNHYFLARETTGTQTIQKLALINNINYFTYDASLRFNAIDTTHTSDVTVFLSYLDEKNAERLTINDGRLTYVRVKNGVKVSEKNTAIGRVKQGAWHTLDLHRHRTSLSVDLNSTRIATFELPLPLVGKFGIGSVQGGVGFDDVIVKPSDDPETLISFAAMDGAARKDWDLVRGDHVTTWSASELLQAGDQLMFHAPCWSNSQVELELERVDALDITLLFPWQSRDKHLELRLTGTGNKLTLSYTRKLNELEEKKVLGQRLFNPEHDRLRLQSINGLFAIMLNDEKLYESNEYGLVEGTLGFVVNKDMARLPVRTLKILRLDMVYDSFPLGQSGELSPEWTVQDGRWKVISELEGAGTQGDGQLAGLSPGTVLIGKKQWRSTSMQLAADFSQDPDFALLGWVNASRWTELHCGKGRIEIRKVCDGSPITLASVPAPALKEGWHKIDFLLGSTTIAGKVDGIPTISTACQGGMGQSGIKNYGSYAAFDNLILQVLEIDKGSTGLIRPVDTSFIDIENSIIK